MKNKFKFAALCIAFIVSAMSPLKMHAQCGVAPTSGSTTLITGIINTYFPGTGNPVAGATSIVVGGMDLRGNLTAISAGDLIFIIQIQGADINSSNSISYGANGTAAPASGYLNNANLVAGNYEYAIVASISGTTLTLSNPLVNRYYTRAFTSSLSIQSYQVIRVPRYYDLAINTGVTISAPSWNGSTGGVIIIEAANTITLNGSVTVAASGFRGGGGKNFTGATTGNSSTNVGTTALTNTDYRFNSAVTNTANLTGGSKGEGIAGTPIYTYVNGATLTATGTLEGYINGSMGWGAPGNAGGGGTDGAPVGATNQNQYNTGGGGGGNGGAGGNGGNGWPGTGNPITSYPTGGYGGATYPSTLQTQLIMGGGGGAGTANNSSGLNEVNNSGGQGGGIIIIRAFSYSGSGTVKADGGNAPGVTTAYIPAQTDAAGGGGAGGTIIIVTTQNSGTGMGTITASATGGAGGNMLTYYNHGPGGGGGGGDIYYNISLASATVTGGINGVTYQNAAENTTYAYFSTPGGNGSTQNFTGSSTFISTGTPCGVLAIILKDFSAVANGAAVDLFWSVQSETNFNYFGVEYSTDGINFSNIGNENYSASQSDYKFVHQSPQSGNNFYRLKMVDADGKFIYSNILLVKINGSDKNQLLIYPNPAVSFVTLQYNADNKEQISFELFDNNGRRIINKYFSAEKGQNYFSISDIKYLSKSVYMLRINNGSKIFTQKLIISK